MLFDARGERLRPAPLEVKEGDVTSVAFGPEGKIAAGYSGGVRGSGVVLFDARGERLRPAPLEVKEGSVTSVAFGPEGKIAAGYGARPRRRRGALRRPGRAAPTRPAGGQGGRCQERGLRAGGPDRRGISRRRPRRRRRGALRRPGRAAPARAAGGQGGQCHERGLRAGGPRSPPDMASAAASAAWCSSTPGASGSDPRRWRSRRAMSRAWPSGRRARSPRDMAASAATSAAWCSSTPGASGSDPRRWRSRRALSRAWPSGRRARSPRDMAARRRRRRGALRRPGRAAPARAAGGQGGRCHERGLRAGGPDRRGIWRRRRQRRRRGALRRPGRAAPTRAAGGQGGLCHERGLRAGGQDRRGICPRRRRLAAAWCSSTPIPPRGGGRRGRRPVATSRGSSGRAYFPETSYRRTIRSLPWPHDLPEAERKQAEAFEKEYPEGSDAS